MKLNQFQWNCNHGNDNHNGQFGTKSTGITTTTMIWKRGTCKQIIVITVLAKTIADYVTNKLHAMWH